MARGIAFALPVRLPLLVGWCTDMAAVGGQFAANYGWAYGEHRRMLVAFSLDGQATIPEQPGPVVPVARVEDFVVDPQLATRGAELYPMCSWCHGSGAVAAGMTPDLRASRVVASLEGFAGVVRDGERAGDGMPMYSDISYDDLVALQHYIRQRADAALAAGAPAAAPDPR